MAAHRLVTVVVGAAAGLAVVVTLGLVAMSPSAAPPAFDEVRATYESSEARLLDRYGEILHELRVDDRRRRLSWTALDDISPALSAAVIFAEDRRFRTHRGADWMALAAGAWQTLAGSPRGASTLTMQLAAQLDPRLGRVGGGRSWQQKWRQIRAARALERHWTKAQILEAYLNLVSYRGELEGIAAASHGLFGKHPAGLDAAESALLAALLRGPNASPSLVAQRACTLREAFINSGHAGDGPAVGDAQQVTGFCDLVTTLAANSLSLAPRVRQTAVAAPHIARRLLTTDSGAVVSTLDGDLQRFATSVVQEQLHLLERENVRDAAVLVVDNISGEVLAYVGNSGTNRGAFYVDGIRALRQPGSVLKPFLYGMALEERWLTAASLLDDSPVQLTAPTGEYVPQNYDRSHRGWVSVRTALAGSLNIPAVRTLMLVGVDAFIDRLRGFGFTSIDRSADHYGYALALGSAEVSLWDLVNAYRTLANGGLHGELTVRRRDVVMHAAVVAEAVPVSESVAESDTVQVAGSVRLTDAMRVMDDGAAFIVSDILADRGARGVTFGFESPLALSFRASVKTGTSKDMRDNWCIGYSDRYTVGVWVGNFDGEPMRNVSGVSGAAPIWASVMEHLHGRDTRQMTLPANVVTQHVRFEPAIEAPRSEFFIAGTQTDRIALRGAAEVAPRIEYPGDGAILALDPDIPAAAQRVFFSASPAGDSWSWRLNGEVFTHDGSWQPRRGQHELALLDASGAVLHRVRFTVR